MKMPTRKRKAVSIEELEQRLAEKVAHNGALSRLRRAQQHLAGSMPPVENIRQTSGQLWLPTGEHSSAIDEPPPINQDSLNT